MRTAAVTVLMDLPPDHRFHLATLAAVQHAAAARGAALLIRVVSTDSISDPAQVATESSGLVIGPGSPYREPEFAHSLVREARERGIPLVGT
ncbi:MAG TPA: hypothetical protein VET26_05200 [Candidatus Sulfotelmatobacter sp.]|nr:hypothetical protein [Candidatus Sulfotelmatobacter sp.]